MARYPEDEGKGKKQVKKEVKNIFDSFDHLPDTKKRHVMHIFNNDELFKKVPDLNKLTEATTEDEMVAIVSKYPVSVGLLMNDFYSVQHSYPYGVMDQIQRFRVFFFGQHILRIECSKKVIDKLNTAYPLRKYFYSKDQMRHRRFIRNAKL